MKRFLALIPAAGLLTGVAAAETLLIGYDEVASSGATQAWSLNGDGSNAMALWGGGSEVWGMAYDPSSNTVYANDGSTLRSGPLGAGSPANEVTINDGAGANLSFVGLAWANGNLYGTRNVGDEAVYLIDTDNGVASIALQYENADYDFGGLAYNPADGLFYGTNDDATPNGSGLYSLDVFGGGAITLVSAYPAGETDIDGLAVGNGVAYLVEDEAGDTIHPYDLGGGAYLPSVTSPMETSEIFSGAAWVPEPASLSLLALGGLTLLRRR